MENRVISIVSGGFDPIHPGHIMMMKDCLKFSNYLIVGVNSNKWLINKKGNYFMDIQHRLYVVSSLNVVNETMEFEDDDKNLTKAWLRTKGNSLEGGTSEVQLNVISKRVLGLPSQ